jgi:MFS family permease
MRLALTVFLFESTMYAAVTPLLPHYAHELRASKAAVGVLAAGYSAGLIPGALLGGLMALRGGVRLTMVVGLTVFAVAVSAFGFATQLVELSLLRVLQGVASGCIWGGGLTWVVAVAPRERRGQALGEAISAAVFGTLLGPLLGTIAVAVGTQLVFGLVGATSLVLAGWVLTFPEPLAPERVPRPPAATLVRERGLTLGLWLVLLEAMAIGATNALIPLRLSRLGASGIAIGATFVIASAVRTVITPALGRASDRRGPTALASAGLAVSGVLIAILPLAHSPIVLALLTVILFGGPLTAFLIPSASIVTDSAERVGLALAVAMMLFNLAYAFGETIGAPVAAVLAQATTDAVPLALIAALMAVSLRPVLARRVRPAVDSAEPGLRPS